MCVCVCASAEIWLKSHIGRPAFPLFRQCLLMPPLDQSTHHPSYTVLQTSSVYKYDMSHASHAHACTYIFMKEWRNPHCNHQVKHPESAPQFSSLEGCRLRCLSIPIAARGNVTKNYCHMSVTRKTMTPHVHVAPETLLSLAGKAAI